MKSFLIVLLAISIFVNSSKENSKSSKILNLKTFYNYSNNGILIRKLNESSNLETELYIIKISPNIFITENVIQFSIFLMYNNGKINSDILTINSEITYDGENKNKYSNIDCTFTSEEKEIVEYYCSLNIDKTVSILKLHNDLDFGGIKPNKIYLTKPAEYSMKNIIANIFEKGFNGLERGVNIFKVINFTQTDYEFIINIDTYPNNYTIPFAWFGYQPDINGKLKDISCSIYNPSNNQLIVDCDTKYDYKAHMNNTLFLLRFALDKSFIIVFNEKENDLVNIAAKPKSDGSTTKILPSSSGSIIFIPFIVIGSIVLIIIIILIICYIKKRKIKNDNANITQVSSNSTEPEYKFPKN